eukprot:1160093-Pelagomonas_calceolata.AAC.5
MAQREVEGEASSQIGGDVWLPSVAVGSLKSLLNCGTIPSPYSVLDTPEFFWHAPDNFQTLYESNIDAAFRHLAAGASFFSLLRMDVALAGCSRKLVSGIRMCRVNEYLELPARVELLNSRFSVLQEMLDMVRNHQVRAQVLSHRQMYAAVEVQELPGRALGMLPHGWPEFVQVGQNKPNKSQC